MVDHDPGVKSKRSDETSGIGAIVGCQADEGDPFFFNQLARSSSQEIPISVGTLEQGPSLIKMVNRYSSKDRDAITSACGMTLKANPSQTGKGRG